jgi:hypothetical protein
MVAIEELNRVLFLISWWLSAIKSHNAIGFFDINKVAEDVSLRLLNEIYGYQLENLNYERDNYPGIDLGDEINKIGFQITSRKDTQKIQESLEKFIKGPKDKFSNGIYFLILTQEKKPQLSKEKYSQIYPRFDPKKHILTATDLIKEIRKVFETDKKKFHRIKYLLENVFGVKKDSRINDIRYILGRYWQLSITILTVIATLILSSFFAKPTFTKILITLFVSTCVTVFIRSPGLTYRVTRRLFGSPKPVIYKKGVFRGPESFSVGDKLPGRSQEIRLCQRKIKKSSFFILEGESGCGKSSLLHAGLMGVLGEGFNVVELNVNKELKLALQEVIKIRQESKPILICIDQFEELFTSYVDTERTSLFKIIFEILSNSDIKILVSIRSDFRDLLDKLCREVDPEQKRLDTGNFFYLKAFTKTDAEDVLEELLFNPEVPLTPMQSLNLKLFITSLVDELLRPPRDVRLCPYDEKTVLPVELQIIGFMIENLGTMNFNPDRLKELGGKHALMRTYLHEATLTACKRSGLPKTDVIFILKEFISEKGLRKVQSVETISSNLNINLKEIKLCLEAFQKAFLLKEIPPESCSTYSGKNEKMQKLNAHRCFTPIHDYIAILLLETNDPLLRKTIDMESRLRFWVEHANRKAVRKKKIFSIISQDIPTIETIKLLPWAKSAHHRKVIFKNIRIIAVKMILILSIFIIPLLWSSHISEYLQTLSTRIAINQALDIEPTNKERLGVQINSELCYVWFQPFQCGKVFHMSSSNSLLSSGKYSRFDYILSTLEDSKQRHRWYLDRSNVEALRDEAIFNELLDDKSGIYNKLRFPMRPNLSFENLTKDIYIRFADDNKGIKVSGSIARLFAEYKLEVFIGLPLSNHVAVTCVINQYKNGYVIGGAPNENPNEVQVIYILIREGMDGKFEWGYYYRFDQFPFGSQFFKTNWTEGKLRKSAADLFRENKKN